MLIIDCGCSLWMSNDSPIYDGGVWNKISLFLVKLNLKMQENVF